MRSLLLVSLLFACVSLGLVAKKPGDASLHASEPSNKPSVESPTRVDPSRAFLKSLSASKGMPGTPTNKRQDESDVQFMELQNARPTPQPTGPSSLTTTVHIQDASNFAILLPREGSDSTIGNSENNAIAYCFGNGGCQGQPHVATGFIRAAAIARGEGWIQVTGCIDSSRMGLRPHDEGGQYDVRYPDGAQCTFGGYGKSFIQQVEPASNRFCLRCCSRENDQTNCNSHMDTKGCVATIPGQYVFPEFGVSCG